MKKQNEYQCVMTPNKPIKLKSYKWSMIADVVSVRNFSIDDTGKEIDGDIEFKMLTNFRLPEKEDIRRPR